MVLNTSRWRWIQINICSGTHSLPILHNWSSLLMHIQLILYGFNVICSNCSDQETFLTNSSGNISVNVFKCGNNLCTNEQPSIFLNNFLNNCVNLQHRIWVALKAILCYLLYLYAFPQISSCIYVPAIQQKGTRTICMRCAVWSFKSGKNRKWMGTQLF